MSGRDEEVMRILLDLKEGQGRAEAQGAAVHEYVKAVSEKLSRHVENGEIHVPRAEIAAQKSQGLRLEVKHLSWGGLITGALAVVPKAWAWLKEALHHAPAAH